MLKKVFAGLLSLVMAMALLPIGGYLQDVKASEVTPFVIVTNEPMSETKSQNYSVSYSGESTSSVGIKITLNYIKHTRGSNITYDAVSAKAQPYYAGSFVVETYGNPKLNVNLASKTVYVTGEVNIYYTRGTTVKYLVATKSYGFEFNLK